MTASPIRHRPWQHKWRMTDQPLGSHVCDFGYCHHYVAVCICGRSRIDGYCVEELR